MYAPDGLARYPDRPRPATSLLRWRVRTVLEPERLKGLHRLCAGLIGGLLSTGSEGVGRIPVAFP